MKTLDTKQALRKDSNYWRPVSVEVKTKRLRLAQVEFNLFVQAVEAGEKSAFDLALWLQSDGYRLKDLRTAFVVWSSLVERGK